MICLHVGATLIRKRDGSKRLATPLEEVKRSWGGKKPMHLEYALHQKVLDMQMDPDNDDKEAKKLIQDRREWQKKKMEEEEEANKK